MRLELDGIGAAMSCGIDIGMRRAETTVVRLRDFGDDVTGMPRADAAICKFDGMVQR